MKSGGLSKLQEIGAALRDFRASGKRVVAAGDSFDQSPVLHSGPGRRGVPRSHGNGVPWTASAITACITRTPSTSWAWISTCSAPAPSRAIPINSPATTWRRANAKRHPCGSKPYGMPTSQDVTRARSLPAGALKDFVTDQPAALQAVGGDMAKMALQRGLVTALKSKRQVADDLKGLVGEDQDSHSFNSIGMKDYLAAARSKRILKSKSDAKIGIIVASGEIFDGHQPPGAIGGESTSDLLRQARYDNAVKAVVLRVDSPGGSEFASEEILREVQSLRKAGKPVVVSMSSYAASGGYYIAAAANQIFASPTTLTGSIGVFSVIPTFQRSSGKNRRQGRRHRHHAARRRAAAGSCAGARYQADPAGVGGSRLRAIPAACRRRQEEDRRRGGQDRAGPSLGRVDAQRIGLVDHLGGLKDATDAAAKIAELGAGLRCRVHRTGTEFAGATDAADSIAGPRSWANWQG